MSLSFTEKYSTFLCNQRKWSKESSRTELHSLNICNAQPQTSELASLKQHSFLLLFRIQCLFIPLGSGETNVTFYLDEYYVRRYLDGTHSVKLLAQIQATGVSKVVLLNSIASV